jgi:hypothetical protein
MFCPSSPCYDPDYDLDYDPDYYYCPPYYYPLPDYYYPSIPSSTRSNWEPYYPPCKPFC